MQCNYKLFANTLYEIGIPTRDVYFLKENIKISNDFLSTLFNFFQICLSDCIASLICSAVDFEFASELCFNLRRIKSQLTCDIT